MTFKDLLALFSQEADTLLLHLTTSLKAFHT